MDGYTWKSQRHWERKVSGDSEVTLCILYSNSDFFPYMGNRLLRAKQMVTVLVWLWLVGFFLLRH